MSANSGKLGVAPIVAAALAWVVPGAGHIYMGRRLRGIVIFVVISATFWAGIAIGGVMTVDPQAEPLWFYADMVTGIHGLESWQRYNALQAEFRDQVQREAQAQQPGRNPSNDGRGEFDNSKRGQMLQAEAVDRLVRKNNLALVAPGESVARAYCGVAGMLNLMCIFDAFMLAMAGMSGEKPPVKEDEEGQK